MLSILIKGIDSYIHTQEGNVVSMLQITLSIFQF